MIEKSCKVLITAYSIYNGYQLNPSEEIAGALKGSNIGGCVVKTVVLKVSYRHVKETLPKVLEEERPDIVIGLGLSPRAKDVTLELAAAAIAHYPDARDEDGYTAELRIEETVWDDVPAVYPTRLPVGELYMKCRSRGLPLSPGVSVGTYMCNVAAYIIHRYAWKHSIYGGFLHLPPSTELALRSNLRSSIPLKVQLKTLECIIETLARKLYENNQIQA